MKKVIFLGMLIASSLGGCNSNDDAISSVLQLEKDIETIQTYLDENSIVAQKHESGVFYVINRQGTGVFPDKYSNVTVNYKGNILGETEFFDSNNDTSFSLLGVVVGWQIGIPLISEGGSITLYIPSGYAYGTRGTPGSIPANANLKFQVDLLDVL